MSAVEDALEALGHPHGTLPEPRLLADLFVRFQAQVPLRRAQPDLGPAGILTSWLEDGAGCCGGSRVRVFAALASAAGFSVEEALARGPAGERHTVLLAHARRVLLDPAFPLPAPLSLDSRDEPVSTGYGALSVRAGGNERLEVSLETRGDERSLYQIEPGEGPASGDRGREPVREAGPGQLFRLLEDRLLRWRSGALEVSDAWSRLRIPFPASAGEGLEALFGPPIPELARSGPAEPSVPEPTLSVYHASTAALPRLQTLLADPAIHAALLPEGWTVTDLSVRRDGFDRTLVEGGTLLRRERITLLPEGVAVEAEGPLALFRLRRWRLEPRPSGTRLRIQATLRDPVPPHGLSEGTRRRLVFELASELLALDGRATQG
ncbi:MAG: hypothetical protein IPN03_07140 [Holophagales bacterium]|nr:hypothetical protein [Holophagales bacterium]